MRLTVTFSENCKHERNGNYNVPKVFRGNIYIYVKTEKNNDHGVVIVNYNKDRAL